MTNEDRADEVRVGTARRASVHVLDFDSLRSALTWRVSLQRSLTQQDGLSWVKALTTLGSASRGGFALGIPSPRRQILIAGWRDDSAFEEFYANSPTALAWRRHCESTWHALLRPLRVKGSFKGAVPFITSDITAGSLPDNIDAADTSNQWFAVLTLGRCLPSRLAAFTREGTRLADSILDAAGLILALSAGFPTTGNATFSIWERQTDMLAFAYENGPRNHRSTIERHQRIGILGEQLTARFSVLDLRPSRDAGATNASLSRLRAPES